MRKTKIYEKKQKKLNHDQKKLVENNIALAYSRSSKMSKRYLSYNLSLEKDDFDSYAFEGLCEAAIRFDVTRNVKFSTFAVNYIDNYIKTNVYLENSTIKVPSYTKNEEKMKQYRCIALKNALVTSNEIGCQDSDGNVVNLDSLYCCGKNEVGFELIEDSIYLDFLVETLSEKDKNVFIHLVHDGCSLADAAESLGIHLNTVSRRKKRIAKKIKKYVYCK